MSAKQRLIDETPQLVPLYKLLKAVLPHDGERAEVKELGELGALDLAPLDFTSLHIDYVQLEDGLGQIQTNDGQICSRSVGCMMSLQIKWLQEPPLCHSDAVSAGHTVDRWEPHSAAAL